MIQLQFINYVLKTKNSQIILENGIDETFFSDYYNEFKYIKDHIEKYGNVPDETSFVSTFPQFDFIVVNETPQYLLKELYHDKNERSIASTCNKIRELYINGKNSEAEQLAKQLADIVAKNTQIKSVDILQDTSRYDIYVDKRNDLYKNYVKTSFPEVDNLICGWDRHEELATIIARPGIGKSWILLRCATEAVKQGLCVGLYSGEMSVEKVGFRADTLMSGISNMAILHGDAEVQNSYQNFLSDLPNRYSGKLKVLTPSMIGGLATVSQLRAFIEKENLDILFIDQHSLLEDERGGKSPTEKAANISKSLKALQVLKGIPIIAVSQMNRTKIGDGTEEDEELDLTQVAQTDRIGQDSTVVIGITRKNGVLTLHLIKTRDSVGDKKLKYAIDLDKGIFTYIPIDVDALGGQGSEELKQEYDGNIGEDVF